MINLYPGIPLTDGTYSDSRPLLILELIRVTGLPDDFFIPTMIFRLELPFGQ